MKLSTHTNYKCDITQNWTVEQKWNSFFDSHFSGLPIIKSNGRSRFLIGLGKLHCISSLGWWWSGSILRPNITAAIGVLFVNGRGEAVINKKCISNYLFLFIKKRRFICESENPSLPMCTGINTLLTLFQNSTNSFQCWSEISNQIIVECFGTLISKKNVSRKIFFKN